MFSRVLIANRGEIALRIARACKQLGIETVGVHSTADNDLMHLRLMDYSVCIGPPPAADSYLNIPAIISAVEVSGADAVHPGYGFLAENADFADRVLSSGYTFIGPSPEIISKMGDKATARQTMEELGMPVIKGSEGILSNAADAASAAREIGYPVLLKASAGGGGRGTRVVQSEQGMREAFDMASAEAEAAFGDKRLYLEKFLQRPRHIELQIIGDGKKAVHFGERDCSLQRRRQKVLEEAPAWNLNRKALEELRRVCIGACEQLGYQGAGTIETLYEDGEFYFLEMNARIQVEHPVSEMISGSDLVALQLLVASGESLPIKQQDIPLRGHAIECRINAEDPYSFRPSPGTVERLHCPGGNGVRFDSHIYSGYRIPPYYDSLIGKLVCWGEDRATAIARTATALDELYVEGVDTTQALHQALLEDKNFLAGNYHINYLENEFLPQYLAASGKAEEQDD